MIPLNALPHTADYILYDDMEKLWKFINIIQDEVALRKKLFAEKMVQNFTVYNQTNEELLRAVGKDDGRITKAEATQKVMERLTIKSQALV